MRSIDRSSAGANLDAAVRDRYRAAAQRREAALCCPVSYDPRHLAVIPQEVVERDYGCGDPSRVVSEGDVVLDLGSGGGKVCFIAAQIVGARGFVIGVDENPEMLALARGAAPIVAERVGYANVRFVRGRIEDLALDSERLEAWVADHPVRSAGALGDLDEEIARLRRDEPMIPDASIDVVISNCVLNLVADPRKQQLMTELARVLRPGGRFAIADIVSDEPVPAHLKADPELWSGCIAGAFQERELLEAFERAGFQGLVVDTWAEEPFAVVGGIEFRSVTVTGRKPETGPCLEGHDAVLYRGPWRCVEDEEGHVFERGVRTAVCRKTLRRLAGAPWARDLVFFSPRIAIPEERQEPFDCARTTPRHPRETRGSHVSETRVPGRCDEPGCC